MTPGDGHELRSPSGLLAAFDSSPDLMCVRDLAGRLVRVNRAWELTLGYPPDEMANTPMLTLVHSADVGATRLRMAEADGRRDIIDFVNRYRRRDGPYRYMKWQAQRVGDVILGRARDVTELRARDDQLRAAGEAMEHLLTEVVQQVGAPADDILRTVRLLGRTRLTAAQRTLLHTLQRSVQTLEDLASRLDEVDRLGAAKPARSGDDSPGRLALPEPIKVHSAPRYARGRPDADGAAPSLSSWVLATLRLQDAHRAFHNRLRDLPSWTLGLQAIRLDGAGELYPRRLFALVSEAGLMSGGRAAALLRRLQDAGFVTAADDHQTGRIRPYRVQPAMTQAYAGWLAAGLRDLAADDPRAAAALAAVEVDAARATPLLTEVSALLVADGGAAVRRLGGLLNGAPLMDKGPAIALAIGADAAEQNGAGWEGWTEIVLTGYAARAEISRAHVRRVLQRLEPCGLVRDPAAPSRLRVTRRFKDAVDAFRAEERRLLGEALQRSGSKTSGYTPS